MNRRDVWQELGRAAIAELDIKLGILKDEFSNWNAFNSSRIVVAIRVFRQIGSAPTVYALKNISSIEDINFISGFCALLLGETDKAKSFLAKSINPVEALDLCRDLLQWEQAMALAETLSPEQIPLIAREYAHQLEYTLVQHNWIIYSKPNWFLLFFKHRNRYAEALANYEKGMDKATFDRIPMPETALEEHKRMCAFGIARTSIRLENFKKGVGSQICLNFYRQNTFKSKLRFQINLAIELNDKQLFEDCAEALITMNETVEAAQMFELAENWDRASEESIKLK